jgi:hypothetical protein
MSNCKFPKIPKVVIAWRQDCDKNRLCYTRDGFVYFVERKNNETTKKEVAILENMV